MIQQTPEHKTLVRDAGWWLRHEMQCAPVVTEPGDTRECPDAIGWRHYAISHVVECKVSEADRKREHNKSAKYGDRMGLWGWLLCPAHLFEPFHAEELGLGLLYWHGPRSIVQVCEPPYRNPRRDWRSEMELMRTAMARMERTNGREANEARGSNAAKLTKAQHDSIQGLLAEHAEIEACRVAKALGLKTSRVLHDAKAGLIEGVEAHGEEGSKTTLVLVETADKEAR